MNYSLYLARRLSLAANGRSASPAVKVAVAAVALSVAVMMAAVAIVLGFKNEIRDKVIGFNSEISIYASGVGVDSDNLVSLTPTLRSLLDSVPFVTGYSLQTSMPAIMKTSDNFKGVYLKSAADRNLSSFLKSNLEEGSMPDFNEDSSENKIVISRLAANQLKLKAGDKIDTYFITDKINVRRLIVAGIYNSHFDNYDNVLIFGSLPLSQRLASLNKNQGTSVQVSVDDFNRIEEYTDYLNSVLAEATASGLIYKSYRAENARVQGQGYFRWLELLDMNVAVVLVLMTFVACVTLVSGMLIIILDKKNFIGIVRALGSTVPKVRKVFMYLAMRVAFTGMLIGNVVMISVLYLQDKYHFIPLDPESYYIDFVPVDLSWRYIVVLNAGVALIAYLVLILPSRFVAGINPAETMRYE